jgi:hypothetical protein
MSHQLIAALRATLTAIDDAPDAAALGALYTDIVGYNPFESTDDLDDLDDVRMTLTDYVKEAACAAGIHWLDVVGSAA